MPSREKWTSCFVWTFYWKKNDQRHFQWIFHRKYIQYPVIGQCVYAHNILFIQCFSLQTKNLWNDWSGINSQNEIEKPSLFVTCFISPFICNDRLFTKQFFFFSSSSSIKWMRKELWRETNPNLSNMGDWKGDEWNYQFLMLIKKPLLFRCCSQAIHFEKIIFGKLVPMCVYATEGCDAIWWNEKKAKKK